MTDKPLLIVDGSNDPGVVTLELIADVISEGRHIASRATGMTHDELTEAVRDLAEAVADLAAQLYRLGDGARAGRLAIDSLER